LKENGTQAITLGVQGMTCAACQAHVERALRETEGVTSASVNLMTHSARVEYQPDVARLESLFEAVREAGYDVSLTASAESEEDRDKQERRLKWKAIAALVGGVVVMVLSMPLGMNGHPGTVDRTAMEIVPGLFHLPVLPLEYAMLLITLAGMIWAGGTIYQRAWQAARHLATNMNTLVALGTGAAFLYSLAATVAPGFFAAHGLRADIYYDSVLLILGFLLLGNWLDARAKRRTLDALHGFAALQPQTARMLRDGEESDVRSPPFRPESCS
jgi:Cu+-exporting ATPase